MGTREPERPRRLTVEFRFYGRLGDFLPPDRRGRPFRKELSGTPSIKDAIESIGVPHPEVELLLLDSQSVPFDGALRDGDRVTAYPAFESLDISELSQVRVPPLEEPRFILDVHLGKLARLLRLLGFDTAYERDFSDEEIELRAARDERIILTRDLGLLKRGSVRRGSWVRSQDPRRQIREVVDRYGLRERYRPFRLCLKCNGPIVPASREDVAESLEPGTARCYREFYRCASCAGVYWRGAHDPGLRSLIEEALARDDPPG